MGLGYGRQDGEPDGPVRQLGFFGNSVRHGLTVYQGDGHLNLPLSWVVTSNMREKSAPWMLSTPVICASTSLPSAKPPRQDTQFLQGKNCCRMVREHAPSDVAVAEPLVTP